MYPRALAPRLSQPGPAPAKAADLHRRTPKRSRIACKPCRQTKLRCEDSGEGSRSCRRCRELSRSCIFERDLERSNKAVTHPQTKAAAHQPLADAYQCHEAIATTIGHGGLQAPLGFQCSEASAAESPHQTTVSPDSPGLPALEASNDGPPDKDSSHQCSPAHSSRTLNSINISQAKIQHLFDLYFIQYNALMPILSLPASPDMIYDASPLLFWTLIITAARHDRTDLSLLETLVPDVQGLLWATIARPPHTLPTLQAMCILCVWPLPASSWSQDITYLLAGVLKSAALQAGIHQPEVVAHFSRRKYSFSPSELRKVVQVWCCIFLSIESAAMVMGQPPFFPGDRTIEQASTPSNPYELPETLHQAITIQLFRTKVNQAMAAIDRSGDTLSGPRRSLSLQSLEFELQGLEGRSGRSLSYQSKVELLSACVQLRGYWLLVHQESSSRREGIILAYDAAIDLITEIESGDRNGYPLQYLILGLSMVCFAAGALVAKVIHSSYRNIADVEKGTRAFSKCIYIFRQCSVEDNDMPGRASRILAQLWGVLNSLTQDIQRPPQLRIATRMFFSIVHDALWLWRDKYEGKGRPPLPPPFIPKAMSDQASARVTASPAASATCTDPGTTTILHENLSKVPNAVDINGLVPALPVLDMPGGSIMPADGEDGVLWDHQDFSHDFISFDTSIPGLETAGENGLFF